MLGSIALVAGTTIGAGILALPAVTQAAGVLPATIALCGTWAYMVASGLLLAEVRTNLAATTCDRFGGTGILAMVRQTLGRPGAIVAGIAYALLHYALLVAYLARGGEVLQAAGMELGLSLPNWVGPCLLDALLGGLVLWGSTRWVERVNSLMLLGAIAAFMGLVGVCLPHLVPARLLVGHWEAISRPLPTLLVAMVFHNTVPTVATQQQGDIRRIRRAILLGSALALGLFLVWNAIILGCADPQSVPFDPLQRLMAANFSPQLPLLVSIFSGLAIATSFVGFVYGLLDFFADLWPQMLARWRYFPVILVPPLVLALAIPGIFFSALDFAGIFGIAVLFGLLPALMAWQQRCCCPQGRLCPPLVPGGWFGLGLMVLAAAAMVLQQLVVRVLAA